MVHTEDMAPSMGFLLKAHAADMCTRDRPRMRSVWTHALGTFKGTVVQMHHRNVSIETIAKSEAAITRRTLVVSLLQMGDAVVFVGVSSFSKRLVAGLASKGL